MDDDLDTFLSKLILQGESILAEISRLSGFITKDFKDPGKSIFKPLLHDFKYFGKQKQIENELANNTRLQFHFYELHNPAIISFELLFDAISDFILSFREYCGFSGDSARTDFEGISELEVYCLYNCGLILLYIENYLPGIIRERIYVAIYRKSDTRYNAEFLVDFLKSPSGSSDTMVKRAEIPLKFVENCVDVIEIGTKWEHSKAQLMFVALQFHKQMTDQNSAKMNRIVNSIYREEWAFNLGFGLVIDIFDAWYYHKASWNAINAIITTQESTRIAEKHLNIINTTILPKNLIETTDFDANLRIIGTFNRSLKWLMLHSRHSSRGKALRNQIPEDKMFQFLLEISNFELKFLESHQTNVKNRELSAKQAKSRVMKLLGQLVDYYQHGLTQLNTNQRENVVKWIKLLSETVTKLDLSDSEATIEIVQQIQRRIKQASDLLGAVSNVTLKEHIAKIDSELRNLASYLKISSSDVEAVLLKIESAYLWPLIPEFVPKIQDNLISTSNTNVVRQMFVKFGIAVIQMKFRLRKIGDERVFSRILNTWSYILESNLRIVLQSVPQNLFKLMHEVISPMIKNQQSGFLDKTKIRQVEEMRRKSKIVKTTWSITNISLGISRMMLRKIGTVRINPRQLLEDGMGKQLFKEMKKIMNGAWDIDSMTTKCAELDAMRSSFIYMCEFMNVDGHRMWNETLESYFARIFEKDENRRIAKANDSILGVTNPAITRFSDNQMLWVEMKSKKVQFSFDMLVTLEKMVPFHMLSAMESAIFSEFDIVLKDHLTTCRKISLANNIQQMMNKEKFSFYSSPEFEKLVKSIQSTSFGLAHQIAQIGQLLLMLKSIGSSKRLCNEMRDNRIYHELKICSRHLAGNPDEIPTESIDVLLKLLLHFSLFEPRNLVFSLKDDPIPVLMIALIQCVLPKIGDPSFVCPKQLEVGILFLLNQCRLRSFYIPILRHQLPRVKSKINGKNSKKANEVDRFIRGILQNL